MRTDYFFLILLSFGLLFNYTANKVDENKRLKAENDKLKGKEVR